MRRVKHSRCFMLHGRGSPVQVCTRGRGLSEGVVERIRHLAGLVEQLEKGGIPGAEANHTGGGKTSYMYCRRSQCDILSNVTVTSPQPDSSPVRPRFDFIYFFQNGSHRILLRQQCLCLQQRRPATIHLYQPQIPPVFQYRPRTVTRVARLAADARHSHRIDKWEPGCHFRVL